jgi:transcriptional regulator with XRE-family HTH domain
LFGGHIGTEFQSERTLSGCCRLSSGSVSTCFDANYYFKEENAAMAVANMARHFGRYSPQSPVEFAELAIRVRKQLGWKQLALADEAGVTERTIQRLERGERVSDDTLLSVAKALGLMDTNAESLPDEKSKIYQSVASATLGLHETPLAFGQFLRKLPDATLHAAAFDESLLLLITCHAMLIVDGNPDAGIEIERLNHDTVNRIRSVLIIEHFRRIVFLRARYPIDPFADLPEIIWWRGHPYVDLLYSLPPDHRENLQGLLLRSGDLRVLTGQLAIMSEAEQTEFADRFEEIEKYLVEFLNFMEEEYGDAKKVAWSEPQ